MNKKIFLAVFMSFIILISGLGSSAIYVFAKENIKASIEQVSVKVNLNGNEQTTSISLGEIVPPEFDGYEFTQAYVRGKSGDKVEEKLYCNYLLKKEGELYWSWIDEDSSPADYIATDLSNSEVVLDYIPITDIYEIEPTIENGGSENNKIVSIPERVKKGNKFQMALHIDRGYSVEVKVNDINIEQQSENVYVIDTANIGINNETINVTVKFIKKEKFTVKFVKDRLENLHGATWKDFDSENGTEYSTDGKCEFYLTSAKSYYNEYAWRLNSFSINDEPCQLPIYLDGSGEKMATTVLSSGTTVKIELVERTGTSNKDYQYKYKISIEDNYDDLEITFINFVATNHHEVLALRKDGVSLEAYWGKWGASENQMQWIERVVGGTTSFEGRASTRFRFKLMDGYANPKVEVRQDNETYSPEVFKDPEDEYYYFEIKKNDKPLHLLSISSDVIFYSVKYISDTEGVTEEDGSLPIDNNKYSVVGKNNIIVSDSIPYAMNNYEFSHWTIDGLDTEIKPHDTLMVNELIKNRLIKDECVTLRANWVKSENTHSKGYYQVEMYFQNNDTNSYEVKDFKIFKGQIGREVVFIGNEILSSFDKYAFNKELSTLQTTIKEDNSSKIKLYFDLGLEANYKFVSKDPSLKLPFEIMELLPYPHKIEIGSTVTADQTFENLTDGDNIWVFRGWNPQTVTNVKEDVTFVGTWEYAKQVQIINHIPSITAYDKTFKVGDEFNNEIALKDVTAHDEEDGDVTKKLETIEHNVDTSKAGVYYIIYKVTDSQGASSTKTVNVYVHTRMEDINNIPVINAEDKELTVGDSFDPRKDVTAIDKEDGDLISVIEIIENTVDTSKAGIYHVTYKVTDKDGASAMKTVKVVVKDKEEPLTTQIPEKPDKNIPATGDSTNIYIWLSLMATSGLLLVVLSIRKKMKL